MTVRKIAFSSLALALVAGCSNTGEIEVDQGVGISAIRSPCPRVGVPAGTGDVTLFNPPASRESTAIDVTAVMTNVQSTCSDAGDDVITQVTFEVQARRASADGARSVTFPYFITLVRGGTSVVAKRVGQVTISFAPGELRASTSGTATTSVSRAAASLPDDVRERLTKRRRAGDQSAALDPLADPAIRQSVLNATFEALIGFQLTDDQLKYNVTR